MKKSELITGVILALAGAAALAAAILTETAFDGIFWGIAGAGLGLGVGRVIQWFRRSSPKQAEKYREMLENKEIQVNDELNRKLRDQSGRIAYSASLGIISVTMMVLAVLDAAGVIQDVRLTLLVLGAILLIQIILGVAVFSHLRKKY
jgi:hypothetical protein